MARTKQSSKRKRRRTLGVGGSRGFFDNGGQRISNRTHNECTVARHRIGNYSR